jgi:ADP-heptose:LPS heptosyltransferase
MRRCTLPLTARPAEGLNAIHTGNSQPVRFQAVPEQPPAWLDLLDHDHVEVHAALPMRYYIAAEQTLGMRLPATHAPAPTFTSAQEVRPFHVVFVTTTSWPDRKDYGIDRFAGIARTLADHVTAPWTFSLITNPDTAGDRAASIDVDFEVLDGLDAADCVDVFASAELVIGNDTGLTHLAALTQRTDGTGPQVLGIYGRHSHTKWTTGSERHHAVATSFSQMLSAADRCPVRDQLNEPLWASAASLATLPAKQVADFAGQRAGWW